MILQDRKTLEMTGVLDVGNFDETTITVYTSLGALKVSGGELHIQNLNLDTGALSVEGNIEALSYEEMTKGGLWSRLFR